MKMEERSSKVQFLILSMQAKKKQCKITNQRKKLKSRIRVLTNISSSRRLGELLNKQRAAEISFESLKFMRKERKLR